MENITFTDITNSVIEEYYPKPASHTIPEWYKDMDSYLNKQKIPTGKGEMTATLKRCMPVFDVLTAGYILLTPADIFVTQRIVEGQKYSQPYFEWSNYNLIEFHTAEQAPTHPKKNNLLAYPKIMNPWGIKTPKEYSTLFIQPVHRKSEFTIFEGFVDTDTYFQPVNLPFTLNNPSFEGLIPAGTPYAQVIPIKRNSWEMKIGDTIDKNEQNKTYLKLKTKIFDSYKDQFRQKKEYK
jgi:hypothetical protein